MSLLRKHGVGPMTLVIGWLDDCPKCGFDKTNVTGFSISNESLWCGDEVKCIGCGHKGEIDADGENAWVEWDSVEAAK